MIADRSAVHAVPFGQHCQFHQLSRAELLRRRFVSQFQFNYLPLLTRLEIHAFSSFDPEFIAANFAYARHGPAGGCCGPSTVQAAPRR